MIEASGRQPTPRPAYIGRPSSDETGDGAAIRSFEDQVVERARTGDRDAFEHLFRLHHAAIARVCRAGLHADVDDAVAEVFVRAWAGLPRYRTTGAPFVAWLYAIARNVVADEFRRRSRVELVSHVPEQAYERAEADRIDLERSLDRLPEEQRQVIELKYIVGLSNPEIAAAMETTTGAVNARRWRGLRALADMLGTRDGT